MEEKDLFFFLDTVIGQVCFPPDSPVILDAWDYMMSSYSTLPSFIQIDPGFLPIGENRSRLWCFTIICNSHAEDCKPYIKPYLGFRPTLNTLAVIPYLRWQKDHGNITAAQHGYLYLTNIMMPEGATNRSVMAQIQTAVLNSPSKRNLVIMHMGGAEITRYATYHTAFPHRKSQFVLQIKAIWESDSPIVQKQNMDWVNNLKKLITPLGTGSYVNYMDPFLTDYGKQFYWENYNRLRTIKSKVDPSNLFQFPMSIPPMN